jgi:hypothetical protein
MAQGTGRAVLAGLGQHILQVASVGNGLSRRVARQRVEQPVRTNEQMG